MEGLLTSLHMLIETQNGFDYSETDFIEWVTEVGFTKYEFIKLGSGNHTAAIAYKE